MKKYIQPRTEEINLFTETMLAGSPDVAFDQEERNSNVDNSGWTNKKDGGMFGSSNYWDDKD